MIATGNFAFAETTLWISDGTAAGTRRLGTSAPSIWALSLFPFGANTIAVGPNLFYSGFEPAYGGELYTVPNDRPVAVNDSASAVNDSPSTRNPRATVINVLSNDGDPDGALNPGAVRVVRTAEHGAVSVRPDGTLAYTPVSTYSGPDSFTYAVADTQGYESAPATVTLTVTAEPQVSITGRKGGGGAMGWWGVLMLGLMVALRRVCVPQSARSSSALAQCPQI